MTTPRNSYPDSLRARALALIDSGRKVYEVARELKVEKNTLYMWSSKKGREEFAKRTGEIAGRLAATEPAPARANGHRADAALAEENERLRRENAGLKKLVEAYREMAGV